MGRTAFRRRGRVRQDGRVTSRAVLVTGGSRGIGRAVVKAFAAGGDRVAIHHRDSAELAEE
ncbi:SDR family NAD(P)-dependent oxidoreductase, partial [Micromonospora azadirachtae]